MVALDGRVLCVVGHPDDEVIGCGATLAKAVDNGAEVRVLLTIRRTDPRGVANWHEILGHFAQAAKTLGAEAAVAPLLMAEEETTEISRLHDLLVEHVEWATTVITHWSGDVHQVHRQVSRAVEIASRPFRRRRPVLLMEVATSSEQAFAPPGFHPNLHVEVSEAQMRRKLAAMEAYTTEHDPGRRPEDLELRMRHRGLEIGAEFAEAFIVARDFL